MATRRGKRRLNSNGLSLNETLRKLRLVKTKNAFLGSYDIRHRNGTFFAQGTAHDIWIALRERGLIV